MMPYDPKTNRWVNTTRRLNRERDVERNADEMSDEELLADAFRQLPKQKRPGGDQR